MISNKKIIGWYLYGKQARFLKELNLMERSDLEFKEIDLDIPISKQEPFDLIICKPFNIIDDDIKMNNLLNYYHQNPNKFLDPWTSIMKLTDRREIHESLKDVHIEMNDVTHNKMIYPETLYCPSYHSSEKLIFPLIYKPILADGCPLAHNCSVINNIKELTNLKYPCMLQKYHNHNGFVYKIYVIGDKIYREIRPSSLHINDKLDNIVYSSNELLSQLIQKIKEIFNISLFGIDLIYDDNDKIYYIIDINYFPSYSGVPNLNQNLLLFFNSMVKN
jgi:inositol-1,3,4-trisphosphate 5/6-kinase/inositol-tetrakisphosphate 1-kinase